MSILAGSLRRKYPTTTEEDIARLHLQATYGTTYTDIVAARNSGNPKACEQWVDTQLAVGTYNWAALATSTRDPAPGGVFGYDISGPESMVFQRHYEVGNLGRLRAKWHDAISRFFSINFSTLSGADGDVIVGFWKFIEPHIFGNCRDLLRSATLSHQMAFWLTFMGKGKATATNQPDENYARELMQLYSIGLWELNLDGSRRKNGQLDPGDSRYVLNGTADVPTYTNVDVGGLARVFTGYGNYASTSTMQVYTDNTAWNSQTVNVPAFHESGTKVFLGITVPASTNSLDSLNLALDRLVTHDSHAPFMAKTFIQMMTTSNPSPGYIARVASAYKGAGGAAAGDLKRLIKAILMDSEARSTTKAKTDNTWGRVQDYWTLVFQNFTPFAGTRADGANNNIMHRAISNPGQLGMLGYQHQPPSVFRHYSPEFSPDSSFASLGLVVPELQFWSEARVAAIQNNHLRSPGFTVNVGETAESQTPSYNFSTLTALGTDAERLDRITLCWSGKILAAGAVRTDVLNYMAAVGGTALERVKACWRRLAGYPELYILK